MYALTCNIIIGNYVFKHVNHVSIENTRKSITDYAVIKLPKKYKSAIITEVIKEGDPVKIQLGYNDFMRDEFTGFVAKIGCNTPVEIHCEDQMWTLKRTEVTPRSWSTVKLSEIINYVAPGCVTEVPDISLSNFYIKGRISPAKVLESLKDKYNLDVYFRADNKLFVGIGLWEKADAGSPNVIYNTTLNLVSTSLTYRRADAVRIKLRMESHTQDGKVITYEAGDPDGEVRTSNEYNMSLEDLKRIADARIKEFKFDGLEGSIISFGDPHARHGMVASIYDPLQPQYHGAYIIDSVNTTFGLGGFRRTISLGRKVSG